MLKTKLLTLMVMLAVFFGAKAQVVTTTPALLQEDSEGVTIYYHADQGNKALADLPADTPVYAHTGVLTSTSKDNSDWKYAPTWGDNDLKYKMERVSENLYKLYIGDIRTYYGVPATQTIKKLAFVFRNADGSKEGKTVTNGDILVDVLDSGLQVAITTNLTGNMVTPQTAKVHFTISSTQPARLSLGINGEEIAYKENTTVFETDYTFTGEGTYNCWGNATADGKTVSQMLRLAYAAASPAKDYPGGKPVMGPVRNADGTVTFCLAAPGMESVILVGSWADYVVSNDWLMNYQDYEGQRYFWLNVPDLAADQMYFYYFVVNGMKKVGDPYARLVLDPFNDKSISKDVWPDLPAYPTSKVTSVPLAVYQENINDYDWKVKDFKPAPKSNLIIYELLFRDFTGTEGRRLGNGTVRKAIEKLPYLKALGVNCIELMPINEFNGNNSWGYNPNFYFAPDKAYGTPDDYKEFIDLCHENGIAVVLDMVFNQTDWLHPWYQMYDVGSNPFYNADAPHAYSVLNDWNQGHPLVRRQWQDVVKYWMTEYKVDGYRFDLVKGLGNNDSYANNGDSGTNAFNQSRIDNMRAIQQAMLEVNPDCIFINENLAGAQEENAMATFGQLNWSNANNEGCQFAMGIRSNSGLNRMYAPREGRTWGSTVSYLESHDEERLAYKQKQWGATGVKGNTEVSLRRLGCAAAQMILAPGSHMIWQFSELGNDDSTKSSNGSNNVDPKPVRWNYYDEPDRRGLYDTYARLIAIRNNNPELFAEDASYEPRCASNNWSTGRSMKSVKGTKELYTFINPEVTKEIVMTTSFSKTKQSDYYIVAQTYGTTPTFEVAAGTVTLPPNSFVTIASTNVVEVEGIGADSETRFPVYGRQGCIEIEDAQAPVSVYSVSGQELYHGQGEATVDVAPGVYVVTYGQRASKVIVK